MMRILFLFSLLFFIGCDNSANEKPVGDSDTVSIILPPDTINFAVCNADKSVCYGQPKNCLIDMKTGLDREKSLILCDGVWLPYKLKIPQ